jgi:transcription initiation factor IIA gamma subunit
MTPIFHRAGGRSTKPSIEQGHLKTYRYCDEVWTFIVEKPTFRFDGGNMTLPQDVKIIAGTPKPTS